MSATPTAKQIEQAGMLFEDIATAANTIDEICFHGAAPGDDAEKRELQVRVMRELVQRMGWMADLGAGKLAGTDVPTIRGGAEEWLMSPSYTSTLREAAHV